MKTLDEIGQALRAIDSHRVETKPTEGNPNSLDVVIVQEFPPPKKRNEIRIEKDGARWLAHPKSGSDSHVAQFVAMQLQVATIGSDDVRSERNAEGLFAVAFRTEAPKADVAPQSSAKRTKDTQEASV
jgi:hypothetical protein